MTWFKSFVLSGCILSAGLLVAAQSYAFELMSEDIKEGQQLSKTFRYNGFGCSGENRSPQLSWSNAPEGTKSFAITMYDPDAPSGSGWWHWSVVNIPAHVTTLEQGMDLSKIGAHEIKTDFGSAGFGGACPPEKQGMHRYQFIVWALPEESLMFDDNASAALVGFTLNNIALGKATLTAIDYR